MTSPRATPNTERPPYRNWILGIAAFSAVTALGGGLELLVWQHGNVYVPLTALEGTVFDTFLVPGVLLFGVVGGTSLACTIFAGLRSPRTLGATWLAGGTLTAWIVAEAAQMRAIHFLHVIYAILGLSLLFLAGLGAKVERSQRHRWIFGVTLAEGLGFLAPLAAALVVSRAGASEWTRALVIGCAGAVEGALLGAGQAFAWPLPVRRVRYVALTAAAAALVWLVALSGRLALLELARPAPAMAWLVGSMMLVVGLTAIGGLQALELRHVSGRVGAWVGWTALAWVVALPLSFLPAPLVDESTPWSTHLPLWATAGFIMAYVMALITERGVRALSRDSRRVHGVA